MAVTTVAQFAAELSKPAGTLLEQLLNDAHQRLQCRLAHQPAIDKMCSLQSVRLVNRHVHIEASIHAHKLYDRHFGAGDYLDVCCKVMEAQT